MPSDEKVRLVLDALQGPIRGFRSTLTTTVDEVRACLAARQLTRDGHVSRVRAELGPLAEGRIDAERFAAVFDTGGGADPTGLAGLEQALSVLTEQGARGDDLFLVTVPPGGSLYDAVSRALAETGRVFDAARLAREARARLLGKEERSIGPLPFSRWTRSERRLAPPLVVVVQGGDLRATALSEFLDGRQRIVLIVEGECTPVPLVRLVTPGTFVLQTTDGKGLDRLLGWDGPGVAALVPDAAARFVHEPAGGAAVWERLRIDALPERAGRRAIAGLSAVQQTEELALLRSLAARPTGSEARAASHDVVVAAGAEPVDPADRLAAWLLSRVNLSDIG